MTSFLIPFACVVLFFARVFYEIARSDARARAQGYGPDEQLGGEPCARGELTCVSHEAPTLGQTLSYDWRLLLYSDGRDVTGTFGYQKDPGDLPGSLFLSFSGGRVKARSFLGGMQVCEGRSERAACV